MTCIESAPFQEMFCQVQPLLPNIFFDACAACADIDFLMPNGILIPMNVNNDVTLSEIKEDLWEMASTYPLFGTLHDMNNYHFACISRCAESSEILEESKCLSEIKPFMGILKVIEREGDEREKLFNGQIGTLIGKGLKEFDALRNPEVNEFRYRMKAVCDKVVTDRNREEWTNRVLYQYPCRLASSSELPKYVFDRMSNYEDGHMYIAVQFAMENRDVQKFTFRVPLNATPNDLLQMALGRKNTKNDAEAFADGELIADYVLKTPGKEEYLLKEVPLTQYVSVQELICHENARAIQLDAICSSAIQVDTGDDSIYKTVDPHPRSLCNSFSSMSATLTKKKSIHFASSWDIQDSFKIHFGIISVPNVDGESSIEVVIEAGLYHGGSILCGSQSTSEILINNTNTDVEQITTTVEKDLVFDIKVQDIPRNTRLAFAVSEVIRPSKGKSKPAVPGSRVPYRKNPLAWVNTTVYDFRSQLKTGSESLYCWNVTEEQISELELPYPLGTLVDNPDHNRATMFTISFTKYASSSTVFYPSRELVLVQGARYVNSDEDDDPSPAVIAEICQIAGRDPTSDLHEQEKKLLWNNRMFCRQNEPKVLPRLLQCVEWNKHTEVAQMVFLLQEWPKLPPANALELLDYAYASPDVRDFAVECLTDLSDDDLLLYLLQLVQALKHENYLSCDLVEFLLNRALLNMRVGHFFFWHLRSEMHVPSVSIRFGLILEAYCRGAIEHMCSLERQLNALNTMKEVQDVVREHRSVRERAIQAMQDFLQREHTKSALADFLNPLDMEGKISISCTKEGMICDKICLHFR